MDNKVALPIGRADPFGAAPQSPQSGAAAERPAKATPEDKRSPEPDPRLVIQEIGDTGRYVYTVVDRASGEVINQFPREEVVRLITSADYQAGFLVRAKA